MDRVDGANTGETAERPAGGEQFPADHPGSDDSLSRVESRLAALAANEKPPETAADVGERAPQPYAKLLDTPIADDQPTPREVLGRFAPADAGLPEVTEREAADHIARYVGERPWLACAADSDPAVQRVLVALDLGQGHALERHEGYADHERLRRRVTALEDPAQLDPAKRVAGIDGCKPGDRAHRCADTATAVQDPAAFATMFARAMEHPDIRDVLRRPFDPHANPPRVAIPIEELLGPDGHRYCSGYRLLPVGGQIRAAMDCRDSWVDSRANDRDPDVPDPGAALVDSFDGGKVQFFFRARALRDGYEVSTMFVERP
ncbi:hypothetical protein [Actinoallomurus sp. CA-142502]|uniref:hypothetical protein n=1 Tax=Actinoallomurus sp. CA-142502 TaxID=3239885 RepID=UPI003D9491E8